MLDEQGSPIMFVTSGQLGLVFHVLTNVHAVPSINPFVVLKSSASTSLKSPQRPGQDMIPQHLIKHSLQNVDVLHYYYKKYNKPMSFPLFRTLALM